jgi:hypothetical protein
MACLQHVERPPHVALAQPHQRIGRVRGDLDVLLLNYLVHEDTDILLLQGAEAEPCTPRQQSRAELVRVVCNDAEARVGRVLLHDAAEGHLSGVCHGVGLVKDDELEARNACPRGRRAHREDLLCGGEGLDLLAHDVDATVVGGIELEHHLAHVLGTVDATGEGEDGRRLACARRAVEQQVG